MTPRLPSGSREWAVSCAQPEASGRIELAHGSGGLRTHQLVESVFRAAFAGIRGQSSTCTVDGLECDAAVLERAPERLALTTDAYVVSPRFFPGGDIGELAVVGTLNDLAMVGAEPRALTASFVLEEGLEIEELRRIAASMARAAARAGTRLVAGDTKVVERGRGDGVFISTTGVGACAEGVSWQPAKIEPGDAILLSGDIGRHGMAILAAREKLELRGGLVSDCAALWPAVASLLPLHAQVACLRDVTRGGLAVALNELARSAGVRIELDETRVPISEAVASACEILGLDPLYLACEGRFVAFVRANVRDEVLQRLRAVGVSRGACEVGVVRQASASSSVVVTGSLGTQRPLDWSGSEQLPRIC